ncbi:putative glycosyltransferase YibD [Halomicronema hongdechloris C2206]|uniref:Glycosyltransferase YibD n=1 Tax=Halomicronema hongdechloris C2206 TaxID=1641165 RepID=A0A1Z3HQA8_9CYAN|nr:glycosyltransferase [Halomicronema hongdechloris]ASC72499.1 putative glycosyltransferase YibD [Halomicronema hongdechloris C2206]
MSLLTISIVIPVYNGGASFRECLASLTLSRRPADEVIVVSDGDTDGSWQVAEAFGTKVFRLQRPGGPAQARNIGAQAAQGDIVFFIDADVTLHPNTLDLVEQQFRQHPQLDALIGSYDDAPGANNFLSQYKNLFHHYTHQVSSEIASTFWGACGAIRRSVFLQVGGFDETYRKPCIEDIELGYRLTRAGYSIALCKEIQVKHLKQWEPLSLIKAEIFYRALPWTTLILRERCANADLNLSHSNRFSVVFAFALIGSVAASGLYPWLLAIALGLSLGLLVMNAEIYRFFYRKRGLLFALQVIPWHWFYFLYGGAAFAYGTLIHIISRVYSSKPVGRLGCF